MIRLIRRLMYTLAIPPRRQTCKDCWRNDGLDFHVSTPIWNEVVAERHFDIVLAEHEGIGGVLCLECFDRRARIRGIDYSDSLAIMGQRAWLADGEAMRRVRGAV